MKHNNFGDYIGAVLDHIDNEYEGSGIYRDLTLNEKNIILQKLTDHYYNSNSINNASSDIISYVRNNINH